MRWNTDKLKALLQGIGSVRVTPPRGNADTQQLVLEKEGYILYARGFVSVGDIIDPSDADIEVVELTDGNDSIGGCSSSKDADLIFYAQVLGMLRRAGFRVVPAINDYF